MSLNFIPNFRPFKVKIQWFLPRRIEEEDGDGVPGAVAAGAVVLAEGQVGHLHQEQDPVKHHDLKSTRHQHQHLSLQRK